MNRLTYLLLVLMTVALPLSAGASVKKEGQWPASDKKVSFAYEGPPSEGLKKLADEAGWSLVVSKGIAVGEHDVRIDVEDQPADAVLEALFTEGAVTASRNGSLVTIMPGAASGATGPTTGLVPPAAPAPPVPPNAPAPVPTVRGEDRRVLGHSLVVGKDEIVHTVEVTGGSVRILGTVTGDLIVTGGSARIEENGRVVGNVSMFGGSLRLDKGARVDGHVAMVGGSIKRDEGSFVGGKITDEARDDDDDDDAHGKSHASGVGEKLREIGETITKMSLLFVFGCVLLALASRRMDTLRVEAAVRPMRSFAIGLVSALVAIVGAVTISITIVGIPFVIFGILAAVLATYGAIAAVLTTFGAAVMGHKSKSPYVHLLVGCVAFLVVLPIPYLGGLLSFGVTMVAIGTLVSTRLGGGPKVQQTSLV